MVEPLRVLILEDNPADVDLIQFELQESGMIFSPTVVRTGKDYVWKLQEFCPDLILSDYDLPGYNGARALTEAKSRCPDTPFILVTGAVGEDRAIEILTQGAKDYVMKARLQQRLVPAVRRALAEAEEQKARKQAQQELREAHKTLEEKVKSRTAELEAEIAERRQTEQALQASEIKYRSLYQSMVDAFVSVDMEGRIRDYNEAYLDMLGYAPEEISKLTYQDITPEKWYKMEAAIIVNQVLTRGYSDIYEKEYRRKDGTVFPVELRATLVKDAEDNPIGMWAIVRDITGRKRIEDALTRSEEKFRKAFLTSPDSVNINRLEDGMYVSINPGFTRIMGYREKDIIGKTSIECNIWENIEDRQKLVAGLRKDGEVNNLDAVFRGKSGAIRYGLMSASIIDINGVPHIISITRDITDRKRAEEEKQSLEERLQRAEKMESLGLLAGGVAHDLNNVIGVIVGYAELIADDMKKSHPMRKYLINVMEAGQKAATIVQDLLTLARRGVAGRKVLNANSLILDFNKSPEWEKLHGCSPFVQLTTDLEPDLLNISASPVHLQKTLFNLVSNAAEAMPQGGNVTIKTANQYLDKPVSGYDNIREGDYVVLSIADEGDGIPEQDLRRIFEPFYTKKIMGRSGTGLGLAVVWGTVKDHQGYIDVLSEEGKGTIFNLYFPVTRDDISTETTSISLAEYMGRGESILVVDDVKGQRDLAAAMLQKLNYKVASVASGEDALEYIKKSKVDLLVLDMIMEPGMDGLDTYKQVLEIHPGQKAIIVSGFSESERVHDAQALGAGEYVKKPYVQEKLGMAVKKELNRSA